MADPLIFVVNRDIWNSWTPADREIVRQAAIEAGRQEVAIARKGLSGGDSSLVKEVESLGVKVTELSEAEKDAFRKAVKPVFDKWTAQVGPDLVKKAQAAVAARRKA